MGNHPARIFLMKHVFRITYERPWGRFTVHTVKFHTKEDAKLAFLRSHEGCRFVDIKDVTHEFYKNHEKIS